MTSDWGDGHLKKPKWSDEAIAIILAIGAIVWLPYLLGVGFYYALRYTPVGVWRGSAYLARGFRDIYRAMAPRKQRAVKLPVARIYREAEDAQKER